LPINYSEDGKAYSKIEFNHIGKIKAIMKYGEDGSMALELSDKGDKAHQLITRKFKTGKIAYRTIMLVVSGMERLCGIYQMVNLPDSALSGWKATW